MGHVPGNGGNCQAFAVHYPARQNKPIKNLQSIIDVERESAEHYITSIHSSHRAFSAERYLTSAVQESSDHNLSTMNPFTASVLSGCRRPYSSECKSRPCGAIPVMAFAEHYLMLSIIYMV